MYKSGRGYVSKNISRALDMLHIIVGVIVAVMAVITFLNPEDNIILFPLIFFFAALLNLAKGIYIISGSRGDKKSRFAGIAFTALGAVLLILAAISALSIWWG